MPSNTKRTRADTPSGGTTRRGFLKASGAAGALSCSELFGGQVRPPVAIIQIYLPGGPSHLDTFDPKPNAPSDVRGEFRAVATSVPGLRFCEHLPGLSALARHLTVVRSLTGLRDQHDAGPFDVGDAAPGRAGLGAMLGHRWGKTLRTAGGEVPTAVDLSGWTSAGPLGKSFAPRCLGRLPARVGHFNELCSAVTDDGATESGALGRAVDVSRESRQVLERYGADAHAENALFLKASRLVRAGVRCVALAWGYWDTHGDNFGQLRRQLPLFDRGLSALIEDLRAEGRLADVVIVAGGEFGRTPRINDGAGRDHWPRAGTLLVAGGGLPHGRVLGATDRLGAEPIDSVRIEDAFAPVRSRLGLAPSSEPPAA